MECRGVPILPTYAQACGDVDVSPLPRKRSLCHTLFAYRTLNDPVIILITLAVAVGSFCLLSGFILLCVVSKAWQDETSEAILLMGKCRIPVHCQSPKVSIGCLGIGFFITSLSCVSWKLTRAQRLTQIVEAISDRDPTAAA
ncbi:uncharacterized protein LOC111078207 isoform X1 [Drosophila obscura]|uniref:uncharacterized protein LOC111078207 isoform X1 n=1 Tax=Drosophila obscura TaxID=7282 RepID=UPI001BB1EE55|nr:uncharacterized protein LOC111078207 isoform X1 [Drosophila obscura]